MAPLPRGVGQGQPSECAPVVTALTAEEIKKLRELTKHRGDIFERACTYGMSLRQADVATMVGLGLTNKEVARELFITEKTVKYHMTSIMKMMRVNSRMKVALLLNDGLIYQGKKK